MVATLDWVKLSENHIIVHVIPDYQWAYIRSYKNSFQPSQVQYLFRKAIKFANLHAYKTVILELIDKLVINYFDGKKFSKYYIDN